MILHFHRLITICFLIALGCNVLSPGRLYAAERVDGANHQTFIESLKQRARGPFERIRWFCKDGAVLPPQAYACKEHGGGSQHGQWTESVVSLREEGFLIANILADLDEKAFLARPEAHYELGQIIIEQFLIARDNGWILRKARSYRGALQSEGEARGARRLLLAMLRGNAWIGWRYPALRETARWLEHGNENASTTRVRQLSAELAVADPDFMQLRNKIHVQPQLEDAAAVRAYAQNLSDPEEQSGFIELAELIETVYSPAGMDKVLVRLASRKGIPPALVTQIESAQSALQAGKDARSRFLATAQLLSATRASMAGVSALNTRLAILDASLQIESAHYAAASELLPMLHDASRNDRLALVHASIRAAWGIGFISGRQRDALFASIDSLAGAPDVTQYKTATDYLARLPGWAAQTLRLHFGVAEEKYLQLEPKTVLYIQDALRGSAVFAYADLLDPLIQDANALSGVRNALFEESAGAGLRALNPGLARGVLRFALDSVENLDSDGIYVLSETVSDLPPVAGIITAGEGNPLSHVQLLARNLGIPNVAVDLPLIDKLKPREGQEIILAVSPGGSVRILEPDADTEALFAKEQKVQTLIRPDLEKLNVQVQQLQDLGKLRAADSGRIVGPKAAKLGELKHHYPEAVADGIAIPFGVFRQLLATPAADGRSMFEWMKAEYQRLATIQDTDERAIQTDAFRQQLYDWIAASKPSRELMQQLRELLAEVLGEDGSFGVFVRSDTNVEDLPGFTGAGLNLTVVNVVGFDNILAAIPRVWASPFTARAFAWRQSHMDQPEHVYPAVLLLESVPAEKSGVLVTQHIDTGERGWLSIAINEGVGGAVDGQAAESLRVNMKTGQVQLLAQATAPWRRGVGLSGGISKTPVTGTDTVLKEAEIAQLIKLAEELPERFPAIVDAEGKPAPADIEFGFLDGKLKLFQIRPFLDSDAARGSAYLQSLDAGLAGAQAGTESISVAMDEVPGR